MAVTRFTDDPAEAATASAVTDAEAATAAGLGDQSGSGEPADPSPVTAGRSS
ncbi:MAG TPA: hypothetical protein VFK43_08480 [Acidimicrobiales bacterium]|nr:hypothetical protein [Acidimicrobiales bacterium]